jgi:hypothetical protein
MGTFCNISLGTRPWRLLNDGGSDGLGIWIDSFSGVNDFPAGFEPTSSPQRISTFSHCTRDHSLDNAHCSFVAAWGINKWMKQGSKTPERSKCHTVCPPELDTAKFSVIHLRGRSRRAILEWGPWLDLVLCKRRLRTAAVKSSTTTAAEFTTTCSTSREYNPLLLLALLELLLLKVIVLSIMNKSWENPIVIMQEVGGAR